MQTGFDFVGSPDERVVIDSKDSDGVDRWVYDIGRMRFWHDWWFVGRREAREYVLRRGPDSSWQCRLETWQEAVQEPWSDLMVPGRGKWFPASTQPPDAAAWSHHTSEREWHAVRSDHVSKLEEAWTHRQRR